MYTGIACGLTELLWYSSSVVFCPLLLFLIPAFSEISGCMKVAGRANAEKMIKLIFCLVTADLEFGDSCIVFPGMGDIHVHAREDETGEQCYKEDYDTCQAAAINGGLVHISVMPNTPAPLLTEHQLQWYVDAEEGGRRGRGGGGRRGGGKGMRGGEKEGGGVERREGKGIRGGGGVGMQQLVT
jgi:hypothetical protein